MINRLSNGFWAYQGGNSLVTPVVAEAERLRDRRNLLRE